MLFSKLTHTDCMLLYGERGVSKCYNVIGVNIASTNNYLLKMLFIWWHNQRSGEASREKSTSFFIFVSSLSFCFCATAAHTRYWAVCVCVCKNVLAVALTTVKISIFHWKYRYHIIVCLMCWECFFVRSVQHHRRQALKMRL